MGVGRYQNWMVILQFIHVDTLYLHIISAVVDIHVVCTNILVDIGMLSHLGPQYIPLIHGRPLDTYTSGWYYTSLTAESTIPPECPHTTCLVNKFDLIPQTW